MKIKSFLAEALTEIVKYNKRKVRNGETDYYLNQKKQLWYTLMNAVDGPDDNNSKADTQDKNVR